MDGGYQLRHRKITDRAVIDVTGTTLRVHVPPDPPADKSFDTHKAAVAAMNAELVRLTAKGWSIADVVTETVAKDRARDAERAAIEEAAAEAARAKVGAAGDARAAIVADGDKLTITAADRAPSVEAATAALRDVLPSCTELLIAEHHFGLEPFYQTVAPWCDALGALGSTKLTRFVVDTYFQPLTRQASVTCGVLTKLFRACPALTFAYVIGCADLGALAHEHLEDLTLMGEPITPDTLRAVVRGPCPRLSRLALGFSYEQGAAEGADAALLDALAEHGASSLPSLTELHIAYPEDGATLLEGLVRLPFFGQLRVLSIAGNVLDDEDRGIAMLREHRTALAKLDKLHLPLEDFPNYDDAELTALIPGLAGTDDLEVFSPSRYREE